MSEKQQTFKHESLQDQKSIQDMLKSISKAIVKGELTFSDHNSEIKLEPSGLLNLKVTAKTEEQEQRLELRISWKTSSDSDKNTVLNIE